MVIPGSGDCGGGMCPRRYACAPVAASSGICSQVCTSPPSAAIRERLGAGSDRGGGPPAGPAPGIRGLSWFAARPDICDGYARICPAPASGGGPGPDRAGASGGPAPDPGPGGARAGAARAAPVRPLRSVAAVAPPPARAARRRAGPQASTSARQNRRGASRQPPRRRVRMLKAGAAPAPAGHPPPDGRTHRGCAEPHYEGIPHRAFAHAPNEPFSCADRFRGRSCPMYVRGGGRPPTM
jgi:hypothetical protein